MQWLCKVANREMQGHSKSCLPEVTASDAKHRKAKPLLSQAPSSARRHTVLERKGLWALACFSLTAAGLEGVALLPRVELSQTVGTIGNILAHSLNLHGQCH